MLKKVQSINRFADSLGEIIPLNVNSSAIKLSCLYSILNVEQLWHEVT